MKHVVPLASLVALMAITPVAGHAQGFSIGSGGGGDATTANQPPQDSTQASAGIPSAIPGILSVDDTTPAGPIKPDSLTHAKAFAKGHHPVVIIDHKVKTVGDFGNLRPASVATYKLQEASDKDVTYYGPNAKNGIITVTLVPPPPPPPAKKKR